MRWVLSPPWLYFVALSMIVLIAFALRERWVPVVNRQFASMKLGTAEPADTEKDASHEKAGHSHEEHNHSHTGHSEANSIEISAQAVRNIGLKVGTVELRSFVRNLTVPGVVVERPGRSTFQISAPLTGAVARVFVTQGEAVSPGQKLFEIKLTHEELVQAQSDLLRTVEELDVTAREIARIEKLTKDGGLPGKALLERQYEQQKQEALLRAQKQALLLHGLSEEQVENIIQKRSLLRTLEVIAPSIDGATVSGNETTLYQVRDLNVTQGQHLNAGDPMAVLVDHAELFIEGNAFERDLNEINEALSRNSPVSALLEIEGKQSEVISDLKLVYVAPQIDPDSRSLHFYVALPNSLRQNRSFEDGRRYISWRFRPGQRTELQIPIETWDGRIVLPSEALVEDGAETYVFTPNGDHFDRRPVHVEYRDQHSVVVANDGSLFPGDRIAITAAKQLQLAIKNKAGGGIDPHAGHNH